MNIEQEIFKRCTIDYPSLLTYGFIKKDKGYYFVTNIMEDTFRLEVEVSKQGMVKSKIYDLAFEEEYTNYRREGPLGEFASKVLEELRSALMDIKEKCTIPKFFMSPQANRLSNLIYQTYQDIPQFPWADSEGYGVFKNPSNEKWYGLVMNINRKKLGESNEEVEIINVKLDPLEISSLLSQKGYYPAYHMNKKNWITILLDDTLTDDEIFSRIQESHQYTMQQREWLVPANPKYYDIIGAFEKEETILWKQPKNVQIGDTIYLYVGSPNSAILYRTEVVKKDIPYYYQDENVSMKQVIQIKLQQKYDKDEFPLEKLKMYGVTTVRGPRSVPLKLSQALRKKEKSE